MRGLFLISTVMSMALAGCGSSGGATTNTTGAEDGTVTVIAGTGGSAPTYRLCTSTFTKIDFLKLMDGNLVFVEQANDKGESAAKAIGDLVEMIVVNGLDFDKLATYGFQFSNGDYSFKSGDEGYTFSLYFASDWEGHAAGTKIPYNVFDYTSYLSNISVKVLPSPSITYDHGPLYDMINGSVSTSGTSLSGLKVSFNIHSELISFSLASANTYNGSSPRDKDTLYYKLASTQTTLPTVHSQLASGGLGVVLDGTVYNSVYYGIVQNYSNSNALLEQDATGYFWELNYESTVQKSGMTFYQTGLASQRQTNTTSYYCDAEHATRIGVATHASDLNSGVFTFEDGTTVPYGLQDF